MVWALLRKFDGEQCHKRLPGAHQLLFYVFEAQRLLEKRRKR
jgi:hypothetical protein